MKILLFIFLVIGVFVFNNEILKWICGIFAFFGFLHGLAELVLKNDFPHGV